MPEQSQAQQRQRRTPQEWLNYFDNATMQQASDALDEWRNERMDADDRSNNNDIQRFFHNIGWTEDTPVVLDEATYQAAYRAAGRPQQLYHTDANTSMASAEDYAEQYFGRGRDANGNAYRHYVSDGILGGGTYFAHTASRSSGYGDNMFRGFLNSNARIIEKDTLTREYLRYERTHPAFKAAMRNVTTGYGGTDQKMSIFAAMKGYNVIKDSQLNYYVILNRKVTTVSTMQKNKRNTSNWRSQRDW